MVEKKIMEIETKQVAIQMDKLNSYIRIFDNVILAPSTELNDAK